MAVYIEALDAPCHRTMLEHDFALISAMQVEPEARADLHGIPVVPERHRSQPHLFPLLVELRALNDRQRVGLLDRMASWQKSRGTPYFSALLACPDSADTLPRHLVKRSDVVLPSGIPDVLRLHDPRLFRHLAWILRPEQHATLLASIRRWTWPEPDGSWRSMVHEGAGPALRLQRLRIDSAQWSQLSHLNDLHIVLANLRQTAPSLTQDDQLAQRAEAAIADAGRLPKAVAADRQLFAEHVIRFGERLQRHPQFQARMAVVHTGQQGYFAAVADLDDETLMAWATSPEPAKECS